MSSLAAGHPWVADHNADARPLAHDRGTPGDGAPGIDANAVGSAGILAAAPRRTLPHCNAPGLAPLGIDAGAAGSTRVHGEGTGEDIEPGPIHEKGPF